MAYALKKDALANGAAWKRRKRKTDPEYRRAAYAGSVAADRARRNTPDGRLQRLVYNAKKRAAKRGLKFALKPADLGTPPKRCPVLGLKLNYGPGKSMDPDRASIDRRNNRKGYVPGNVRVISYRANSLKSDATAAELRAVLAYMEAR